MNAIPKVSVLLPVWNAEKFLGETLESLAAQTFRDFEVIAVDDGSTDRSGELLKAATVRWSWLRFLSQPNAGIAAALNKAMASSRGALLARMDADDIALPSRLELQVRFLEQHPAVGVCGTAMETFGAARRRMVRCLRHDADIRARMVFGCPMAHPTVLMRREVVASEPGPYCGAVEDYDLWLRLVHRTQFSNLPLVLLRYREHPEQYSAAPWSERCETVWALQSRLLRTLHISKYAVDAEAHAMCGLVDPVGICIDLARIESWLLRMRGEVAQSGWTSREAWYQECAEAWWRAARRVAFTPRAFAKYVRSPLVQYTPRLLYRVVRLWLGTRGK